jgi:hypothetical protein
VFGLTLPEYLDCDLFPKKPERGQCIGYQEVKQAELRAQRPGNTNFHRPFPKEVSNKAGTRARNY